LILFLLFVYGNAKPVPGFYVIDSELVIYIIWFFI